MTRYTAIYLSDAAYDMMPVFHYDDETRRFLHKDGMFYDADVVIYDKEFRLFEITEVGDSIQKVRELPKVEFIQIFNLNIPSNEVDAE